MRHWVLPVLAAAMLVAGCSETVDGDSQPTKLTPLPSSPSPASSPTPAPPPAAPPAAGAAIGDVIAWIEAGKPADADGYHVATRAGVETKLGDDVAFVTPSGKTRCMTDAQHGDGALACLVDFADPLPRPAGAEGEWVPSWVDFDGQSVLVGSLHGDPGRFIYGDGPELGYGKTLEFGDYQCRVDQVGLYCANYAHRTAARFTDAGIEPFGCLKPVTPSDNIGRKFSC